MKNVIRLTITVIIFIIIYYGYKIFNAITMID